MVEKSEKRCVPTDLIRAITAHPVPMSLGSSSALSLRVFGEDITPHKPKPKARDTQPEVAAGEEIEKPWKGIQDEDVAERPKSDAVEVVEAEPAEAVVKAEEIQAVKVEGAVKMEEAAPVKAEEVNPVKREE